MITIDISKLNAEYDRLSKLANPTVAQRDRAYRLAEARRLVIDALMTALAIIDPTMFKTKAEMAKIHASLKSAEASTSTTKAGDHTSS